MSMKVLIVDDHESNRLLVKYLVESEGHTCIEAEDGVVAVKQFIKHKPDFVLLDVVMPNMDGYEAAIHIKRHAGNNHVPIIFLTAKHDEASLLKCLESGGDDYLPKPINGIILKAKIKAHARTQELTQQVNTKNEELTLLHATLTQEHEMGQHVLMHSLTRSLHDCPNVKSYLSSMSTFNGDLFLLAENPGGGLYVFLGDFTGHGLGAAIGTVPVSQSFFSMCEKGLPVMDIAASINRSLKSFLPEYMFCAATVMHITECGDTALVWSGGLPDAYIVRPGLGVFKTITSENLPLGILSAEEFKNKAQVYNMNLGDRLILLTDGILEGEADSSNEMFGEQRVLDEIGLGEGNFFENLLHSYQVFSGDVEQQDDISLVEIIAAPFKGRSPEYRLPSLSLPWSVKFTLDAKQIVEQLDPVVQLMKFLPNDITFFRRADFIRSVVSELYSNAVEHGLLKLTSSVKATSEGFSQYYQERLCRLNDLSEGQIQITLDFDCLRTGRELLIEVEDSGDGFNYEEANVSMVDNTRPWGRGIALVRSLSECLTYSKGGRCVEVVFSLT